MTKTLLHTCCGPCACACVSRLKEMGREVTMLFANSNIDTREEFEHRLREAKKVAEADGVRLEALPYDHDEWLREVAVGYEDEPEKGARCARCFRYNLAKAAAYAAEHGYDEFTTSLTVSPHKVTKTIFSAAQTATQMAGESSSPAISAHCKAAYDETGQTYSAITSREPRATNHEPRTTNHEPRTTNPSFLPVDFKKQEGFRVSTRRATELGLYRQSYCGCEFSKLPTWRIHHKSETASTNLDARMGRHGDVFTADFQTAGRGRLDHKWLSPPGTNLMMSVVLSVEDIPPEQVATLPLVIGLSVVQAAKSLLDPMFSHLMRGLSPSKRSVKGLSEQGLSPSKGGLSPRLKWPNDVLIDGRKLAGILCERQGDHVIVGIGVNVGQTAFPPEIAEKATSFAILSNQIGACPQGNGVCPQENGVCPPKNAQGNGGCPQVVAVRSAILRQIGRWYSVWKERGFAAVLPTIHEVDFLKGRTISVRQKDDDAEPVSGVSGGILADGSLDVGGVRIYAGEAHVEGL